MSHSCKHCLQCKIRQGRVRCALGLWIDKHGRAVTYSTGDIKSLVHHGRKGFKAAWHCENYEDMRT